VCACAVTYGCAQVFSKRRQVEVYTMGDIKTHLALDREKLIALALLLGSDYTEGVRGVGVATAMEIIGLFDSLDDFKAWWQRPSHEHDDDDPADPHADAKKRLVRLPLHTRACRVVGRVVPWHTLISRSC